MDKKATEKFFEKGLLFDFDEGDKFDDVSRKIFNLMYSNFEEVLKEKKEKCLTDYEMFLKLKKRETN
jgi:hypothetical protein